MRRENWAAKNPSVPLKPSSDSSQENQNKTDIIPLTTISVLTTKVETSSTLSTPWENSPKITSRLKKSQLSPRVARAHPISTWSSKSPAVRKAETTHGEFHWLTQRTTSPCFTPDQSRSESTKSEVSPTCHGPKSNAAWLETISLTSSKLLTGWNLPNQAAGTDLPLKRAPSLLKTPLFPQKSSTEKEEPCPRKPLSENWSKEVLIKLKFRKPQRRFESQMRILRSFH